MKIKKINFTKMTASGNDFIVIDNRRQNYNFNWEDIAPSICNRRFGVGADGLIVLNKSSKADFKMDYYNSDGSYGGMCGNGGRCSAFLYGCKTNLKKLKFEALDFIYSAELIRDNNIKLKMINPKSLKLNIQLHINKNKIKAHYIDTGSPHTIIFIDELPNSLRLDFQNGEINKIGSLIRYNEYFAPEGTNVDFVKVIDNKTIEIRTYERGVEDETLACGTGAIASSIISFYIKRVSNKINVRTKGGEILKVKFKNKSFNVYNVELIGNAKEVFKGMYYIEMPDNISYVK
jgi:diaminopimelate epimerase